MKKLFKRLFKSAFFRWLLPVIAAGYIRLVYYTSRIRIDIHEEAKPYMQGRQPAVFAFWHGRMLMIPMIVPPKRKMNVLISTHRDGEMIARTMHQFNFGTVRGSSTRGGATAAMQAVKALLAGENVAVTPDGPKGPVMKVQPGVLAVAKMANVPVLPVTFYSTRHKQARSWDRFMVALPFGTIYYRIGAPMTDAKPEKLEKAMLRLTDETQKVAIAGKGAYRYHAFYSACIGFASPFIPFLLKYRLARGKEDKARIGERLGRITAARPPGKLVWIHAASVGESNAVLPLIEALLASYENVHVMITTVTVTSAVLMSKALPSRAQHQFAPVDTPAAVHRFLAHWQPDIALWVDSELWPHLIMQTQRRGIVMGIVNARMSQRSFKRWHLALPFARSLLSGFTLCFAQSEKDGERLQKLGMTAQVHIGNLKYEAPALAYDPAELARLRAAIGARPLWLAASTHRGEEEIIALVHKALASQHIGLLTLIVPRHASRGQDIMQTLSSFRVARRSAGDSIAPDTQIYLADTMGELGLFYSLAPIVFIGGTLVAHGGQNPLEAARLNSAIIAGPHMENFAAIAGPMEQEGAMLRIQDKAELITLLGDLFHNANKCAELAEKARMHVRAHTAVVAAIMQELHPYLADEAS